MQVPDNKQTTIKNILQQKYTITLESRESLSDKIRRCS
jgi:hypothetical protein